jgi:3-phosphoshikimate 1-carboxyvinyltransferase
MMLKDMTDPYEVQPLTKPPVCTIRVPGSKSITNRAMILAALTQATDSSSASILEGALRSEDTEVMIDSLQRLGIAVTTDWPNQRIVVPCTPIRQWNHNVEFFCGNSGTTIRFLTAMLAVGEGAFRLDGIERMRERPIQDLLDALQALGCQAVSEQGNGCPPVLLRTTGLPGGMVQVRGDTSSQYLSALLMAAPYAQHPVTITLEGELVSEPYIDMTVRMMSDWGIAVQREPGCYHLSPGRYQQREYNIEPDASSASYFWAAAAITGGQVTVPGLEQSMQGDAHFFNELLKMGCRRVNASTVEGGPLRGITTDMNAISDTVMSLAVVALFADGPTTITNVAHIRHKETDRLAALATELRKVGAEVDEFPDGLTIHPRPLHGATLDTYNDHRMAMSLSLIGLRIPGIRINNPGCVAKTFPSYWQTLENLRQ